MPILQFCKTIRIFAVSLLLFISESTLLNGISFADIEPYSVRPDILSVATVPHPELPFAWHRLKRSHLEAIAELLALYPDQELYFLGRDSEYLYDFARLMTQGQAAHENRIHLINVSRANARSPHLLKYLEQEGISRTQIEGLGKKIILIDTGFAGTIPKTILENTPRSWASHIHTHLMVSAHAGHPSTRLFLLPLNKKILFTHPSALHRSIISYENLPHFTHRSSDFLEIGGRWEPIADTTEAILDGKVSPASALAQMEDLKSYALDASTQSLFHDRINLWQALRSMLDGGHTIGLHTALKAMAQDSDPFISLMVRDFLETIQRNDSELMPRLPSSDELGIIEIKDTSEILSNKLQLMIDNAIWNKILSDPNQEILRIALSGDLSLLYELSRVIHDEEIQEIISNVISIFDLRPLLKFIIALDEPHWLAHLAKNSFRRASSVTWRGELRAIILRGNPEAWSNLATYAFQQPHAQSWGLELGSLIRTQDEEVLNILTRKCFSKPHAETWEKYALEIIEQGHALPIEQLIWFSLLQDYTRTWKKTIVKLLETSPESLTSLRPLKGSAYMRDKTDDPEREYILEALKIPSLKLRKAYLEQRVKTVD
ncbi:hypothetical protein EBS43_00425 [bacterium]|nr:hypothetical protein [bacterium]